MTGPGATMFSEYIAQILPTSCFGYFGHVWSLLSKTLMPICRNVFVYLHAKMYCKDITFQFAGNLSACKKSTSSLTSFFRDYKEIANLLLWACLFTRT